MPKKCTNRPAGRSGDKDCRRKPKIAFPSRYRNRPASIRHAIYRAWEVMDDLGLSISGVAVLQAVIALGVDVNNPCKPVYAKKEVVAGYAGVSESSVYRTLASLEKCQLIIRYEQQQRVDGSLSISQLSLTNKLLLLLGFAVDSNEPGADSVDDETQPSDSVGSHAQSNVITTEVTAESSMIESVQKASSPNKEEEGDNASSIKALSGGFVELAEEDVINHQDDHEKPFAYTDQASFSRDLTDDLKDGLTDAAYIGQQKVDRRGEPKTKPSADNQSTGGAFVKVGKYSVPVELSWTISEKRLTCPQLFKLMKAAKKVPGQKLEDFIDLRKDRLKELATTNDCYRFINALIDNNIDAKYLVAQRNKQAEKAARIVTIKKAERAMQQWFESREGQTFVDSKIDKSYTINSRNLLLLAGQNGLPDARSPSVKATQNFIDRVTRGELVCFVPKPCNDRIKDAPKARLTQLWSAVRGGRLPQPSVGASSFAVR